MTITVTKTKYFVIAGNPHDGFEFHGPFDTYDEANEYGEEAFGGDDWYSSQLEKFVWS